MVSEGISPFVTPSKIIALKSRAQEDVEAIIDNRFGVHPLPNQLADYHEARNQGEDPDLTHKIQAS